MNLKFKATENFRNYNGFWKEGPELIFIEFIDGQTMDVPAGKAQELLRDFPRNFETIPEVRDIPAPPVDRMLKRGKTKVK
jgi:hypothetical protein